MKNFKNNLPENCPDEKVLSYQKDFEGYHILKSFPPCDDDFKPFIQKSRRPLKENERCQASGLSVLGKIEDAVNIADSFPAIGKYICKGVIRYNVDGVVKITPSHRNPSHYTWYPFEDTVEADVFNDLVQTL